MITPLDIQNKTFRKSLFGYNKKNVNEFLSETIEDYEKIYRENIEYKDKINMLSEQIRQFNSMEETLKSTLLIAQKTAEEVTLNARKKADLIIEEAENERNTIIQKAHEDVKNIKEEYEFIQKEIYIFKTRLESFLESQKLSLNDFYNSLKVNKIEGNESKEVNHAGENVLKDEDENLLNNESIDRIQSQNLELNQSFDQVESGN
ncbi:MAG: DivIVA domain-containing protein [Tissierellales bacterium]|nr:DivIVA domain-containing protein [Tissierellales bacterium]